MVQSVYNLQKMTFNEKSMNNSNLIQFKKDKSKKIGEISTHKKNYQEKLEIKNQFFKSMIKKSRESIESYDIRDLSPKQ